ncbi:MAG: M13 family peptidase, partial [Clostridia bacterium]|nr:M13 family peptidase [Clostridia bacterium]
GSLKNWWSDEAAEEYEKIKQYFIDYYEGYEVVDGVVQDSATTIGENMADFAGMTVVMDILKGDKEAQKEALEAYASVWARIGSESLITSEYYLQDVHSSENVRVDAVIASLPEFYEIYDIDEDDPMYVAPEDRLKLW